MDNAQHVVALRRMAGSAVGCPARLPSLHALAWSWQVRSDALRLVAELRGETAGYGRKRGRFQQLAWAWLGASHRLHDIDLRRAGWLLTHFARSEAHPVTGHAYTVMRAELWVWLARHGPRVNSQSAPDYG